MVKWLLALLLFASPAYAQFTTDERSLLHVGVGFAAGAAVDAVLYAGATQLSRPGRLALATVAVAIPAAGKEYVMDAEPDMGDLFYGIGAGFLGALAMDYGLDWLGVAPAGQGAMLTYNIRW